MYTVECRELGPECFWGTFVNAAVATQAHFDHLVYVHGMGRGGSFPQEEYRRIADLKRREEQATA